MLKIERKGGWDSNLKVARQDKGQERVLTGPDEDGHGAACGRPAAERQARA